MKSSNLLTSVLIAIILLSAALASASNTLTLVSGQTQVNTVATLSVDMENDDNVVAFQVDIPIPSQLTYVVGSATYNLSRVTDHLLSDTLLPNGNLRIIGYSFSNTPFAGNIGELFTFQLLAKSQPGTYALNFTTAVLGDVQSNNILTSAQNGNLTVLGPDISTSASSVDFGRVPLLQTTDRNITLYNTGNTTLNISQIVSSSSYFTVVGSTSFSINAGSNTSLQLHFSSEVKNTYDETLTIFSDDADEATITINMAAVAFAVNEMHTGNMFAFSGDYVTLDFSINNMEPIAGFQFDLQLPSSLTFIADSAFLTSRKANHIISANMIGNNTLRVVAFSADNQTFDLNDGEIVELGFVAEGVGGYYSITLTNVVLGDTTGVNGVSAFTGGTLQIAAADIAATNSIDFGDVSVLETASHSLSINNYGTDTLKISTLQFLNASFFSAQSLPLEILPGESTSIELNYYHPLDGAVSSVLRIFSNDPDEDPYNINLSGNSFMPNYMSIHDSIYSYGDTMFVDILVDNLESFIGFQFDLSYSDSLTCLRTLSQLSQRAGDHMLQTSQVSANTIRVFAFSMSQAAFTGSNGTIVSIPFVGDSAIYGELPLTIEDAILGNTQSQNILWGIQNQSISIGLPQQIPLQQGWNMISFAVTPGNLNMMNLMQNLVDSSSLVKVVDETGGFMQNVNGNGWMNTIGNMANTEGYYMKVNADDTLHIEGRKVSSPFDISLLSGWNMISYPMQSGQPSITALQSLINNGSLVKVVNESGGFIQNISGLGWINTIGNFEPGEGYYLKVNSDQTLIINEPVSKTPVVATFGMKEGSFYSRSSAGNPFMPMHIVAEFSQNTPVSSGDEIGVFVYENCIGSVQIVDPDIPAVFFLATDDPTTTLIDGGKSGDTLTFRLLHHGIEYTLQNQDFVTYFPLETQRLLFNGYIGIDEQQQNEFYVNEIIPNPFSTKAKVSINIPDRGHLKIQVKNIQGIVVDNVFENDVDSGKLEVIFEGQNLREGIYLIQVEYYNGNLTKSVQKKMIILH